MGNLYNAALAHLGLTVSTLIAVFMASFLIWSKMTRSLLGKDFWVVLPGVGKMAEWKGMTMGTGDFVSQIPADAGYATRTLVVPAEKALFDYYNDGIKKVSVESFQNAREYLKLSDQNGRRPMSALLWMILGVLTVAEALGTGLLLAPLLSRDITPTFAMIVASVLALVIAIIAVVITHGAGEDLFANGLLAKVRNTYKQNQGFRTVGGMRSEFLAPIGPENDQSRDAELEPAGRLAARIGATTMDGMQPRKGRIIAAVAFILLFGFGTTAYRHYVFTKQQDRAAVTPAASADSGGAQNFQNIFAAGASGAAAVIPPAAASAAAAADAAAEHHVQQDAAKANDAGIAILALIYVFTQLLGLLTGYKYSFFNDDAEKAYEKTGGQLGYDDFLRIKVHPFAERAHLRLGQLRAKLSSANPRYGDRMNPFDFMLAYHDAVVSAEHNAAAQRESTQRRDTPPPNQPAPTVSTPPLAQPVPTAQQTTSAAATSPDLHALAQVVHGAGGKEARQAKFVELVTQYLLSKEQQAEIVALLQKLRSTEVDTGLLDNI